MLHPGSNWLAVLLVSVLPAVAILPTAAQSQTQIDKCRVIKKSGSYILTRNLGADDLRKNDCLSIREDYVTIDLGGYVMTGNKKGEAITDDGKKRRSITVRNGTITNFKTGIDLKKTTEAVVRDLQVVNNSNDGIVAGEGCLVSDTVASRNGGSGINADDGDCTIEDNVANENDDFGLELDGAGHTVSGNTANENDKEGIQVECPSNLIGNTVVDNKKTGIIEDGPGCESSNNLAPS